MKRGGHSLLMIGRLLILTGVGFCIPFVVHLCRPAVYEARSEFTIESCMRSQSGLGASDDDFTSESRCYTEISLCPSCWRTDKMMMRALRQFRANHPESTTTDKEISDMLAASDIELVPRQRLIAIRVRSTSPTLAAALANAYAAAIEAVTDEENKLHCEKAVMQLSEQVVWQRRRDEDLSKRLLKFRAENKVDEMRSRYTLVEQALQKTSSDIQMPQPANHARHEQLREELSALSNQIVSAESGLRQLEREKQVSATRLKTLIQNRDEAFRSAEQTCEIIRLGRPAVPVKLMPPVYSFVCLAIAAVSFVLGFLFVVRTSNMGRFFKLSGPDRV